MTSTLNESTCCLISFFYIKPQRYIRKYNAEQSCLISFFYIKPQPGDIHVVAIVSCLISFFYIKPQLILIYWISVLVVLYPSSTSNHNVHWLIDYPMELSYILLLHQTTTKRRIVCSTDVLSYILLLHQTTTKQSMTINDKRLSYILLLHQTTTYIVFRIDLNILRDEFGIRNGMMR